jgi:prepilin-type N-terminal cleavage/methylation domain-containing protein
MLTPRTASRVFADGCPRTTDHRSPAFAGLLRKSSRAGGRGRLIAQILFCSGGRVGCGCPPPLNSQRSTKDPQRCRAAFTLEKQRERASAFTLLELLIVISIVAVLLVLIAPAFTTIKGGTDVTSAAYTIKGVLDTARTYAKANNTYTWVGFYEEDVSQASVIPAPDPRCTGCVGRLVMSIVASKDGTNLGADASSSATGTENFIDATQLLQVNKLVKIDNVHLPLFVLGSGTGDTFDARPSPSPATDAPFSRFGELNAPPPNTAPYESTNLGLTKFPFQYPVGNPAPAWQYRFRRTLRFNPAGECRINSTYDVRRIVELGLLQTHGSATPTPSPGPGQYPGNALAVQITGFGGNVKIYRR